MTIFMLAYAQYMGVRVSKFAYVVTRV